MGIVRSGVKAGMGLAAAAVALLSPGLERAPASDAGFRVPKLVASAHATMHVSTIAHLTTVLRFKADIMTKTAAEIDRFMNTLFQEAAAAKDSKDLERIRISTKRLMVMNEALRDRAVRVKPKAKGKKAKSKQR